MQANASTGTLSQTISYSVFDNGLPLSVKSYKTGYYVMFTQDATAVYSSEISANVYHRIIMFYRNGAGYTLIGEYGLPFAFSFASNSYRTCSAELVRVSTGVYGVLYYDNYYSSAGTSMDLYLSTFTINETTDTFVSWLTFSSSYSTQLTGTGVYNSAGNYLNATRIACDSIGGKIIPVWSDSLNSYDIMSCVVQLGD